MLPSTVGTEIKFAVIGEPVAQPRIRATVRYTKDKKPYVGIYDPGTANQWKKQVALAAKPHLPSKPLEGPIRCQIVLRIPRPKSHYRTGRHSDKLRPDASYWHWKKPDRDNFEKAILDALTDVGMWKDDCQVCCGPMIKLYCNDGRPGAFISIYQLLDRRQENSND